jgi:hypothetical protein
MAAQGVDVILTYHSKKAEAEAVVAEIAAMGRKAVETVKELFNKTVIYYI